MPDDDTNHDRTSTEDDTVDDPWTVLESNTEYETGWYAGGYDLVEQPDGSTMRYYWAELAPAVVVVAIDGDDLIFVEQYRPTVGSTQLELVAGIVDEHDGGPVDHVTEEAYERAARRELREETGYRAASTTLLETFAVATGVLRHRRGIVVATDLEAGAADRDENEFLTVTRVPAAEALDRVRAPPTNDASLEGILLAIEDGYL